MHKQKLKQYSALATATCAGIAPLAAQEVYTNPEPDVFLYAYDEDWLTEPGMQYFDLNADGVLDVGLDLNTFSACYACPVFTYFDIYLADQVSVPVSHAPACYLSSTFGSGYSSTACVFPAQDVLKVMHEGDTLSALIEWGTIADIFKTHQCGWYGEACVQGAFDFNDYKNFITFRLIDTDTSYCWMRLRFADDSLFVAEYACNDVSAYIIHDKIADVANNLTVVTDTCTANTDEIHVMFNPANYENSVSEYRIMVAPTIDFSANDALLVSPENYVSVIPTGAPVDVRLPPDFRNYNGVPLLPEQDIKVSVFSIYNTPESNQCAQVWAAPVQFSANGKAEAPISLDLNNHTETYTSADLSLSILSTVDTAKTAAYRLMFLLSYDMPFFSVDMAREVLPENYIVLEPNPIGPIPIPANMTTWNGTLMLPETNYRAVILAMPNTPDYCVSKMGGFSGASQFSAAPVPIQDNAELGSIYCRYQNKAIQVQHIAGEPLTICMYDISGNLLATKQSSEGEIRIPFDQPPGVYVVQMITKSGMHIQKLVCD